MWEEGQNYNTLTGDVAPWMGICHGWAVASISMERPLHAVKVKSWNDQYTLTFFPSDIKALSSLFWANSHFPQKMIGGRCQVKASQLQIDPETRRPLDNPNCLGNPGTWHIA
jgi:hypothetical protein